MGVEFKTSINNCDPALICFALSFYAVQKTSTWATSRYVQFAPQMKFCHAWIYDRWKN